MTLNLNHLTTRRRMRRLAARVAPPAEWSWPEFEAFLGAELHEVTVHCYASDEFSSGEVFGIAAWIGTHKAYIGYPRRTSRDHQIYIAGHEAWHLLNGHDGCGWCTTCIGALQRCGGCQQRENEAEQFAATFGYQVAARASRQARRSLDLVEAFGVPGIGA